MLFLMTAAVGGQSALRCSSVNEVGIDYDISPQQYHGRAQTQDTASFQEAHNRCFPILLERDKKTHNNY